MSNYDEEPQFYPQLKRAGSSSSSNKSSPRPTRQQKFVYRIPGPAAYDVRDGINAVKPKAPAYSMHGFRRKDMFSCSPSPACYSCFPSNYSFKFSFSGDRFNPQFGYTEMSPGPSCYYVDGNLTRTGLTRGIYHTGGFDHSDGWRHDRKKYAVKNTHEDTESDY